MWLGGTASKRVGLGREAVDVVARLARSSGDSAFFPICSDVFAVCVLREDGDSPLKTHVLQPGTRHPLGVGAGSLAMLAALEDADIESALAENAALMAEYYPEYSAAMLRDEVAVTRELGFAVNEGHVVKGSGGFGCARTIGGCGRSADHCRCGISIAQETPILLGKQLVDEARRLEAHLHRAGALQPAGKVRKGGRS